jgi:hypothetical protein
MHTYIYVHGMDNFKIHFLSMAFFEGRGGEFKCWDRSVSITDRPWVGCSRYEGLISGRGRNIFLLPDHTGSKVQPALYRTHSKASSLAVKQLGLEHSWQSSV